MTDVEVWQPTGIRAVDLAVHYWGQASLVPAQYTETVGGRKTVKWPDLTLAGLWCNAVRVDPMLCIKDTYVVHGRVGMMADLQTALLQDAGYDLTVLEASAERATVRISVVETGHTYPPVTVTWEEAVKAGWTKRAKSDVPSNYELMPDRMLRARATTKAISYNAPGVLRGIIARTAHVAPVDDEASGPGPAPAPPATQTAGAGPSPGLSQEERALDEDTRLELLGRIADLRQTNPDAAAAILNTWKAVSGPSMARPAAETGATKVEAALLRRLLDEAVAVDPAGPTPSEVHDDTPESRGLDPDDDPGRPFE